MVARRTLLLGSSGLVIEAVTGCSGGLTPETGPRSPSSVGPPSAGPSASPSLRTPSAVPKATASASPSRPTVPDHPRPRLAGTVLDDLEVPWGIAFLRSGDAVVGERGSGRLLQVSAAGRSRTLGTVPGVAAATGLGEGGLLGLALAPGDEETLFAYVTTGSDNRVVRVSLAGGRLGRVRPVLAGIPASTHHNGGRLLFDPDGMLLVSTGDAEQSALAQSRSSLAGKILRIRPDGRAAPGNPFGNRTWSYGHRNIEGLAYDGAGRLWATEFGDKRADELNLVVKGRNYGWPEVEGRSTDPRYTSPRAIWTPTSSCSPAGIAIAGSTAFVGALQGKCLFAVPLDGTTAGKPRAYFAGDHGRIRSVALAPDGSLWVTTSNTDGRGTPAPHDDRILRVRLR
jgi:glucose/arabinose dehydrogenase